MFSLGDWITVTVHGGKHTGQIYAYDEFFVVLDILFRKPDDVLNQPLPPHVTPKSDFIVLNSKSIIKTERLKSPPYSDPRMLKAPPVRKLHAEKLAEREAKEVYKRRIDASKKGVGVTTEAQKVFDALSKTLPCRWDNKSIVVMDEVIVSPPYNTSSCKSSNEAALDRVKRVLGGERKRMGLNS
ncbi:hypothetical protein ROZALSC1DRAFT_28532 [Rozella allomycis CSF55]|uniref:AD domain-containing protein n=1 Tax=Rozella allomycis (strain CSF55) TaxID=988480 RepID=A0A4P9YK01_ROZAC|nr:hypothetical protein ROZALSC1DRAFT_28532 [Rozella allomycis CSF55]